MIVLSHAAGHDDPATFFLFLAGMLVVFTAMAGIAELLDRRAARRARRHARAEVRAKRREERESSDF